MAECQHCLYVPPSRVVAKHGAEETRNVDSWICHCLERLPSHDAVRMFNSSRDGQLRCLQWNPGHVHLICSGEELDAMTESHPRHVIVLQASFTW